MPKSSYDVVIVGTDLPALIFGALAAKKGYRVLVLGHGGKDNVYEVEGFHFLRRPQLMFGFQDSTPVREVFRELALAPEMRNLPRPMLPTASIVLPDARIEFTHVKEVLDAEIGREFPTGGATLQTFLSSIADAEQALEPLLKENPVLPPGTIREYFGYRRHAKALQHLARSGDEDALAPLAADPRMRAMFAAPMSFLSGLSAPWRFPLPSVRLVNHLMRGLFHVEWGVDALKSLLLERIRSNSGDVRISDQVDMLVVRGGRVREVEIRSRDEEIGVGLLAAGTDLGTLLDLVPERQAKTRFRAKVARVLPSHAMVTINIGARRQLVPEGMAQTAFLIRDPSAPMEGSNALMVSVDPAMEPADNLDPERVTVAVSALLPYARYADGPGSVEAFSQEVLGALRVLLPFVDDHMKVLSTAAIASDPKTGQPVLDPAGMLPIYDAVVPRSLDLLSWPCRTAYRNILFLGEASCGALGFEGGFLAAYRAFTLLRNLIPLKVGVS